MYTILYPFLSLLFADNLLTCQGCQGYYHVECHEDTLKASQKASSQLNSRCPQCVRSCTLSAKTKFFS